MVVNKSMDKIQSPRSDAQFDSLPGDAIKCFVAYLNNGWYSVHLALFTEKWKQCFVWLFVFCHTSKREASIHLVVVKKINAQ